jgi:hypothetical protein
MKRALLLLFLSVSAIASARDDAPGGNLASLQAHASREVCNGPTLAVAAGTSDVRSNVSRSNKL